MPAIRELKVSPLLQECFLRTETACVRECCGLDAFEPDAGAIRTWADEVGTISAAEALREVRELIAASEDRAVIACSTFLNACTPDERSREQLLGFFRAFEAALAARVQRPHVIHRMAADRVERIIADYERGALTEASACVEVLLAAGEGDAEAVFARLTHELRAMVSRHIADADPGEVRIIESYCGMASQEAYEADRRRREEIVRRGIVALKRLTSGDTGGG